MRRERLIIKGSSHNACWIYCVIETVTLIWKYTGLQRKQSKPYSISFRIYVNVDQKLYEGEECIRLCERQIHSTVDGDLPGSVFDSKQQTVLAVIDRVPAPVFPSALWFWRFGKSATQRGPPISSEPNIVRVVPAPMLLACWIAGMPRITGLPKIWPGPL